MTGRLRISLQPAVRRPDPAHPQNLARDLASHIDPAAAPGQIARRCIYGPAIALYEASELDAALRHGHRGLELARQATDEKD